MQVPTKEKNPEKLRIDLSKFNLKSDES